tara:strand:+ start:2287 stop:2460 length:174 start_codon:yes stop_codon:yes gene_type:complete
MLMKNGDIVMLKSGGPNMTIVDIKNNEAKVKWFGTCERCFENTFEIECLKLVEQETK